MKKNQQQTANSPLIIQIPEPKFDLYEFVWLYWNDQRLQVKVVARWYALDQGGWWYQIAGSDRFYPEQQIEREI